ncbi:cyclase family protein [Piscirickettsia litoralis]|uniref:Cyclase n=1 Tax=Piscirickettsia litoralis TaxID=1891921 RepID=A0ABX3A7T8_9GAMM|nr:cyclase family protein [Piscirickettsia litoralis]ODN42164.1 cyclase [Piscirickettsia litoralis]
MFDLDKYHLIDLTHFLDEKTPCWEGGCGFSMSMTLDYPEGCRVHSLAMNAGIGTHLDAPRHFCEQGESIDQLKLEKLIAPVIVLDVRKQAEADYLIHMDDIHAFEAQYGQIAEGCFAIGLTGWGQYWHDQNRYRNVDEQEQMHFPGFSLDAAKLLLERKIVGIGIDTLSPDGGNTQFPVHHLILGAGCYIVENLAYCEQLPVTGAYASLLPLNLRDGTESPIRAVAAVPNV